MMNYEASGNGSRITHHDRLDKNDSVERIYPYPAVPRSVRPYLERCFDIENVNSVDPDNERMLNSLDRLSEINSTLGLVRAYCGIELSGAAYKAAALGVVEDLADGLGNRHNPSIRAEQELGKFFVANAGDNNDIANPKNVYIAGLLQDRRRLDHFRAKARSKSGEDYVLGREHDTESEQPSRDEWLADPVTTDADTMYETVEMINLESILISGAETLVQLTQQPANDRRTLDLVRYSEQIIAPIAEVIGFDTLAMSLNSTTKSIRLTNGGRGYLLHRANAIIDRFRGYNRAHGLAHNVCSVFRTVLDEVFDGEVGSKANINMPVDYGDDNQSVYGDTPVQVIETSDGPVKVSWRFRLKTPGSLAWKMYQEEKRGDDASLTPMDILGITAVVENDDDQIKLFQDLANGLYSSDSLNPHNAPSKSSAVHVKGMSDYIKRMTRGIVNGGQADVSEVKSPDALHYGKVTGFYDKLPFEIQCVTRHFRDSMQIGPLAHIIYKMQRVGKMETDEVTRWTSLLADIRSRRARLGTPGLVGSYDIDPATGQLMQGSNERMARALLDKVTQATPTLQRTIGFIATESSMRE